MGAIFLSASVPTRPPFDSDSRPQEIQAAINALAQVVLGRKKLVWGGHPAITPLLWAAAQSVGIEYALAVELFQSRFFEEEDFPKENQNFANVTYVAPVSGNLSESLKAMRLAMITSTEFDAAVFIGGMDGIRDEYDLFKAAWPEAVCIPIAQTGGAASALAIDIKYFPPVDIAPLDFVTLFYRELNIQPRQKRESK
ncbi:hypothetical protein FHW83_000952 [Duganella sp. SG902]|uniref:SLOG domain-containing protein n=1 Tax=Duganella sp. SG902 TaxID=2587016 RepID=UPI00159E2BE9|nr:hypothetical protein [Duganella sp. SG902]NVM75172.1 hypothetical protein [Duganella sp. SG902]